jgi:hypothetical protein
MTLVCQSWEMSLPYMNQGETHFAALPLSQLTLVDDKNRNEDFSRKVLLKPIIIS